jgi:hypothetical protein
LQVFSGNKHPVILNIEREIWSALIDVAKGTAETLPRLQVALGHIENIIHDENIVEMSGWFGGVFIIFGIDKLSDRQIEREELARHVAVEAAHTPDAGPRNGEDDIPTPLGAHPSPTVPTPSPPQTPVGDQCKSRFTME